MTSQLLRVGYPQLPTIFSTNRTTTRTTSARPFVAARVASAAQKLKPPGRAQKGTQRIQPKKSVPKKPSKPSLGTVVKRKAKQVSMHICVLSYRTLSSVLVGEMLGAQLYVMHVFQATEIAQGKGASFKPRSQGTSAPLLLARYVTSSLMYPLCLSAQSLDPHLL